MTVASLSIPKLHENVLDLSVKSKRMHPELAA
jgi:hypothetical protein